jgi:hypothetical protein
MKDVTEAEFHTFLASYPRPLSRKIVAVVEPRVMTYYDPTLGLWPDSMVARHRMADPRTPQDSHWAIADAGPDTGK